MRAIGCRCVEGAHVVGHGSGGLGSGSIAGRGCCLAWERCGVRVLWGVGALWGAFATGCGGGRAGGYGNAVLVSMGILGDQRVVGHGSGGVEHGSVAGCACCWAGERCGV